MKKVAERANNHFIGPDHKPIVVGMIVAGCANLKDQLISKKLLDPRLASRIIKVLELSYGGKRGLNQAISDSASVLKHVKLIKEQNVLTNYFSRLARMDDDLTTCGVHGTLYAIQQGALDTLILWNNLPTVRYVLFDSTTKETRVVNWEPRLDHKWNPPSLDSLLKDKAETWGIISKVLLVDWLVENHDSCSLVLVSDASDQGSQFSRGLGGVGGILRYNIKIPLPCEFHEEVEEEEDDEDFFWSDDTN